MSDGRYRKKQNQGPDLVSASSMVSPNDGEEAADHTTENIMRVW